MTKLKRYNVGDAEMRESFEEWFSDDWQNPSAVERDAVGYKLAQAQNAWTVWQDAWQAALAALREQEPAAWLITGSRAFRDTVVTSEATADRRLSERGDDGSCKVPLYAAPQPEDAPSIPAGYKLVPA